MPARSDGLPTEKQPFNVYTMMLILSFIAIVTACVLLYVELSTYAEPGQGIIGVWKADAAKFTPPPPTN